MLSRKCFGATPQGLLRQQAKKPLSRHFVVKEIRLVVLRDGEVDDLEFSHGAVAATGTDHHGTERLDRNLLAVEFQIALPFEDEAFFR